MKNEVIELTVPGQQEGPALLKTYILDSVSVDPQRRRPAVIVVPGGGYGRRSDREKEPIAMQFLAMGAHAMVLEYSVAPNHFPVSLTELALAVATVREHAEEWQVDGERIFICGFSAGGHLSCSLGTFWNQPFVSETVGKKMEQIKPNGLILCYPVITAGEFAHPGSISKLLGENSTQEQLSFISLEKQVTDQMPPVFLWHTLTDNTVPIENSLLLASAMRQAGVNFELHIYPSGGHGLSLANEETGGREAHLLEPCCQSWISLVKSWLEHK